MKTVDVYFNWQDSTTYVGTGFIVSVDEERPVIIIDDKAYLPKRCLVEIIDSKQYKKGFRKHFDIPFSINRTRAEKKIRQQTKQVKYLKQAAVDDILMRNNPIVDSYDDIKLAEKLAKIRKLRRSLTTEDIEILKAMIKNED